jgi:hypothetical protein
MHNLFAWLRLGLTAKTQIDRRNCMDQARNGEKALSRIPASGDICEPEFAFGLLQYPEPT